MIARLVWRSLLRRPGRSALLLTGYALGVGVTIALLSIGGALVAQARDRELAGGGDLTVLPAGVDLETFRTGGVSSLYFTLEQAPFLYRQVLAGPRFEDRVAAAAPWIDDALLYLRFGDELVPVSAGGQLPSRAAALGAAPELLRGRWRDLPSDRAWTSPTDSILYAEMDAFHLPAGEAAGDTTWAEWHYFNVLLPDGGWLHLTYMVAGDVPAGRWGGRVLATLAGPPTGPADPGWAGSPARGARRFLDEVPAGEVRFSTRSPDLDLGAARVRLTPQGTYRLVATVPPEPDAGPGATGASAPPRGRGEALRVDLEVHPGPRRYLPPLQTAPGAFPSGYVAPVLGGRAAGRVCVGRDCRDLQGARAYHDHNWGVWRDVTWDWGEARAAGRTLLYGGVSRGGEPAGPRFLYVADSLGFAGLLPVREIRYRWRSGEREGRALPVPSGFTLRAGDEEEELILGVRVVHAQATPQDGRVFYQLRGEARLQGRLHGEPVNGAGDGFFETWRTDAGSVADR